MSAAIGYDETGVWVTNYQRESFLDWFADNRCLPGDEKWKFCKSDDCRWPGCGTELSDIISLGTPLGLTSEEYDQAVTQYGQHVAQLLSIIDAMTREECKIRLDSQAALTWCRPK